MIAGGVITLGIIIDYCSDGRLVCVMKDRESIIYLEFSIFYYLRLFHNWIVYY